MKYVRTLLLLLCSSSFVFGVTKNKPFPEYQFNKGLDTYHAPTALPQGYVQNSLNVLFDDVAPATKRNGYAFSWSVNQSSFIVITQGVNDKFYFRITGIAQSPVIVPPGNYTASVLVSTINAVIASQTVYSDTFTWTGSRFIWSSSGGHILECIDRSIAATLGYIPSSSGFITVSPSFGPAPNSPLYTNVGPSIKGLWTYTDQTNTTWEIAWSSSQLTANNLAGTQVVIATVSANNTVGETNAFGNAYFVDQTQGVYYWTGGTSTATFVSGSPKGSIITQFHNRLWVTGEAVPNGNQLAGSGYYNGSDWNTNIYDTSPVTYSIGLQDNFDNVTAEYVYLDTLYLFKHSSIFALYGFSQITNPFQISQLTQECGCVDGNTIQTYNSALEFVSLRGVESFNGYSCTRISDAIKNKIDPAISVRGYAQQSWVQSQQTDWQQGTLTSVSATAAPPSLVLTAIADNFSSSINWTTDQGIAVFSGNTVTLSTQAITFVSTPGEAEIHYSPTGPAIGSSWIAQSQIQFMACSTFSPGLPCGLDSATMKFHNNSGNGYEAQVFVQATNPNQWEFLICKNSPSTSPCSTVLASVTTSISADTNPHYLSLSQSSTGYLQLYWDGVLYAGANDTQTSLESVPSLHYETYVNTIGCPSCSGTSANFSNFVVTSGTGTFQSQIWNVGTPISWGNFPVVESLNSGNIAFSICSSSNVTMSPNSCVSQNPNTQILVATNTYVQWYATFTVTAATQIPSLNSVTVQWYTGANQPPMASTVWDNRYWLSLTTSSVDTSNDAVLVLNKSGAWAQFDIHAGAFTQYKNLLFHADSRPTGSIYLDNQGWSDDGSPINAFINTRNESLGDLTSDDYLFALYPTAMSTGNCPMTVQYSVDNSTTPYSLGSPLLSEFNTITSVRLPFPIDSAHQDFGQSVDFTLGTNDGQCGWQFLGIEGLFKQRPIQ